MTVITAYTLELDRIRLPCKFIGGSVRQLVLLGHFQIFMNSKAFGAPRGSQVPGPLPGHPSHMFFYGYRGIRMHT